MFVTRLLRLLPFFAVVPYCSAGYILTNLDNGIFATSVAYGINSSNQILIQGCDALNNCRNYILQGSTLTPVALAGIQDINDTGQILGAVVGSDGWFYSAVTSDAGITLDVTLRSQHQGVGFSNSGLVAGGGVRGFLYDHGVYTTLNYAALGNGMPPFPETTASDVNDARTVVGATMTYPDFIDHPWVWSGGVFTDLTVPGAYHGSAVPTGINNAGQIVGLGYVDGVTDHQFGWVLNGGVYTTINYPGAVSTAVFQISNNGNIVGNYKLADGTQHAFFGTLDTATPEPAVTLLAGAGLALIFVRRRRAA